MNQNKKDNSGALFINDRKEKETHPDLKGSAVINGVDYWISSWDNETKDGKQYLSLAFTEKEKQSQDPKPKKLTGISARFQEDAIKQQNKEPSDGSDMPF